MKCQRHNDYAFLSIFIWIQTLIFCLRDFCSFFYSKIFAFDYQFVTWLQNGRKTLLPCNVTMKNASVALNTKDALAHVSTCKKESICSVTMHLMKYKRQWHDIADEYISTLEFVIPSDWTETKKLPIESISIEWMIFLNFSQSWNFGGFRCIGTHFRHNLLLQRRIICLNLIVCFCRWSQKKKLEKCRKINKFNQLERLQAVQSFKTNLAIQQCHKLTASLGYHKRADVLWYFNWLDF